MAYLNKEKADVPMIVMCIILLVALVVAFAAALDVGKPSESESDITLALASDQSCSKQNHDKNKKPTMVNCTKNT